MTTEQGPTGRYDKLALEVAELRTIVCDDIVPWKRSQVVRNRARALVFCLLLFVSAAIVISGVLFTRYLDARRDVSENRYVETVQRLDTIQYGACQSLQDAPGDNVQDARETLHCDQILQGVPPDAQPTN